jgi:ubiquinone/menaquinone biosynthesis C-methylase UbiE
MKELKALSRVDRSKADAGKFYDRISGSYDWLGGLCERGQAVKALEGLNIRSGETVLEIGFGTGYCLRLIAAAVGSNGKACGIDLSGGMVRRARQRLEKADFLNRVELYRGDAKKLPFEDKTCDAVFLSFTLELFDSPEIPEVLGEIRRVLKPGGRLGVISLSKQDSSLAVRLYEWVHNRWPKYVDCRPIYTESAIQTAGFKIHLRKTARLVILPVETVIGVK